MQAVEERYALIKQFLIGKTLTTIELEHAMNDANVHCPDDLARTLNVMRRKGLIKGEVSVERGGWVWWVEDQP